MLILKFAFTGLRSLIFLYLHSSCLAGLKAKRGWSFPSCAFKQLSSCLGCQEAAILSGRSPPIKASIALLTCLLAGPTTDLLTRPRQIRWELGPLVRSCQGRGWAKVPPWMQVPVRMSSLVEPPKMKVPNSIAATASTKRKLEGNCDVVNFPD